MPTHAPRPIAPDRRPARPPGGSLRTLAAAILAGLWLTTAGAQARPATAPATGVAVAAATGASDATDTTDAAHNLFALDLALYAAATVATPAEHARLHVLLLGREGTAALERGWPLRQWATDAVSRWPRPHRRAMLAYFLAHPAAVTHYHAVVLQMLGPAPTFAPLGPFSEVPAPLIDIYRHRGELSSLLGQVWGPLGGDQLWRQASAAWTALQLPAGTAARLGGQVAAALSLHATAVTNSATILIDPWMAQDAAVTCTDANNHATVVVGPTRHPSGQRALVAHELAHPLLAAALAAQPQLRARLAHGDCAWQAVLHHEHPTLTHYVYTTWEDYFVEVVIRAVVEQAFVHREAGAPMWLQPAMVAASARKDHLSLESLRQQAQLWACRQEKKPARPST